MYAQLRRERHSAAEPKQSVEDIECEWDDAADTEGVHEGGRDEVEEREHSEDGANHGVVDNGRVARFCVVDHVTDERHNEEGPEEL